MSLSVFLTYFSAIGLGVSVLICFLNGCYQGLSMYSSIWLSKWTDDDLLANQSLAETSEYQDRNSMYLGVYGALGVGQGGLRLLASLTHASAVLFFSYLVFFSLCLSLSVCLSLSLFSVFLSLQVGQGGLRLSLGFTRSCSYCPIFFLFHFLLSLSLSLSLSLYLTLCVSVPLSLPPSLSLCASSKLILSCSFVSRFTVVAYKL